MTDSDFNSIKPVENPHSVHSLTPAQQREEQKRRPKPSKQQPEQQQQPEDGSQSKSSEETTPGRCDDPHRIDYCA